MEKKPPTTNFSLGDFGGVEGRRVSGFPSPDTCEKICEEKEDVESAYKERINALIRELQEPVGGGTWRFIPVDVSG